MAEKAQAQLQSKITVKIHTPDGQYKTLSVDRTMEMPELTRNALRKFGLPAESPMSIYEYREEPPQVSLSHVPRRMRVGDVINEWPEEGRDLTHRLLLSDSGIPLSPTAYKQIGTPVEEVVPTMASQIKEAALVSAQIMGKNVSRFVKKVAAAVPHRGGGSNGDDKTSPSPSPSPKLGSLQEGGHSASMPVLSMTQQPTQQEAVEYMSDVLEKRGLVVNDLMDLRSGVLLIEFIEQASGLKIPSWNKDPASRDEEVANISIAIKFSRVVGCTSIDINAEDAHEGGVLAMMRVAGPLVQHFRKRSGNPEGRVQRSCSGIVKPQESSSSDDYAEPPLSARAPSATMIDGAPVNRPPQGSAAASMASIMGGQKMGGGAHEDSGFFKVRSIQQSTTPTRDRSASSVPQKGISPPPAGGQMQQGESRARALSSTPRGGPGTSPPPAEAQQRVRVLPMPKPPAAPSPPESAGDKPHAPVPIKAMGSMPPASFSPPASTSPPAEVAVVSHVAPKKMNSVSSAASDSPSKPPGSPRALPGVHQKPAGPPPSGHKAAPPPIPPPPTEDDDEPPLPPLPPVAPAFPGAKPPGAPLSPPTATKPAPSVSPPAANKPMPRYMQVQQPGYVAPPVAQKPANPPPAAKPSNPPPAAAKATPPPVGQRPVPSPGGKTAAGQKPSSQKPSNPPPTSRPSAPRTAPPPSPHGQSVSDLSELDKFIEREFSESSTDSMPVPDTGAQSRSPRMAEEKSDLDDLLQDLINS